MTEFRLLGPLEVVGDDGAGVPLPAGKPRALLARLLLDAGRAVAVETLVEAVWPEPVPPSAYKVLQVHVSQLRKALGPDRIETRPPGYVLRAEHEDVDLARFESLAETAHDTADPARRADLLRRALSLWRGPALLEFRDEPFARGAARRVAELRLAAVEQRIDAELELGRHDRLVAELEALVDEEPLRERLRRQLMLALYRSGRQADALARYRDGRRLLVDELGLEPSPQLQELERAILRHDPVLAEPGSPRPRARGCVICADLRLRELVAPLADDARELLLVELAGDADDLARRAETLEHARGDRIRTACFTSTDPEEDLVRLAREQDAELLVVGGTAAPAGAPCDVAVAPRPELPFEPAAPVLVPFGGGREEWAALELAAWIARAHALPLRLLGTEAAGGRRDASRTLAAASLALQRFAGASAEPVLVPPGVEGILAQPGSAIVASLLPGGLDRTRRELVHRTKVPLLLVAAGLRPGGLAPDRTLTRFTWSMGDDG
ncbi:MAG TPA: AfsR/SARP family transcriptional regulator [Gaiellaceae bacterium]